MMSMYSRMAAMIGSVGRICMPLASPPIIWLGLWLWLWLGLGLDTQQTTLVTCILTYFFARLLRVVYDVATHSSSSLVTNLLTYFFARLLGVVYDVATHEHHANEDAREVDQRASEDELYDGEAEQGHRSGRQHAWLGLELGLVFS